jgi:hypothetical protein
VIFQDRRKTGHLDLEAIEMAVRSAMHHAGPQRSANCCNSPSREPSSAAFLALAATLPAIRSCAPSRC